MILTIKTVDRLKGRALELIAISDALYEHGDKEESAELVRAAKIIADAASSVETKIRRYAAAVARGSE